VHEISPSNLSDLHEDPREPEHTPNTIVEHPYVCDEEALAAYALSCEAGLSDFIVKHEITDPAIDAEDVLQDAILSVLRKHRRNPIREPDNLMLDDRLAAAVTQKLKRIDNDMTLRREAYTRLKQFAWNNATLTLEEQVGGLLVLADLESISTTLGAALGPRAMHALRASLFHINNNEVATEVFFRTLELNHKGRRDTLFRARETLKIKLGPYVERGKYARNDDQSVKPTIHQSLQKTPKPTISSIQSKVLDAIFETRLARPATVADIPPYLGPLEIIGVDIREHLKYSEDTLALILYPYREKLSDFSRYMSGVIGRVACAAQAIDRDNSRLIIDTPARVRNYEALPPDSYVFAVTEIPVAKYIREHLSEQASFLLHLAVNPSKTNIDYQAPTYRQAGSSNIQWTEADSRRYIKEWSLLHPQSLDKRTVHIISKKGEGPSTKRVNPKLL